MRFAHCLFSVVLTGAIAFWLPLTASAAWDPEGGGPHARHRSDFVPTGGAPKEPRSMAPKRGVAMQRPVAPAPAKPPEGSRSLAPKEGVAFSRPVGPAVAGSASEMPLASD